LLRGLARNLVNKTRTKKIREDFRK
jgi:hypothetical protein